VASAAQPSVQFDQTASFVVGQRLFPNYVAQGYSGIPMQLHWSATPSKSVCSYDLYEQDSVFPKNKVLNHSTATSYSYTGTNYDDSQGGEIYGDETFYLTARTCAGAQIKEHTQRFAPSVIEDNGSQIAYAVPGVNLSYAGMWQVAHCSCFSRGADHWTSQKGASATLHTSATPGAHLGVVMNAGPKRGIAKIYLDQTLVATVNTNRSNARTQLVVYSSPSLSAGAHTIQVVNASAGGQRIDLDAFLQTQTF
jgi:hypothetical protein